MFWCILLFIWVANAADHDLFKNCSRVPYCADMRHQQLEKDSLFKADISSVEVFEDVARIPLINAKSELLILELSLLSEQSIMRIKITEPNTKRYQLKDVLDKEPATLGFSSIRNGTSLEVSPYQIGASQWKAIVYEGPPFSVEFYNDQNALGATLKGDRLVLKNTSQEFSFSVEFDEAEKLYGLYHHAVDLELPDTENMDPFRLRNSDNAGYEVGSPMAMYGSVPVVFGHSAVKTTGIFIHNAAEQWVDISYKTNSPSAYFMVESGTLDMFILLGHTPVNFVRQFTYLTGVANLPQLWTLGYHQCRWSYSTQEEVKEVVARMDSHDFPMDAIWLDIDYTDGKRYFTWDPTNFSNPVEMQKNISSTGRKLVTILDPHIKIDNDYPVYTEAKGKYFVKWANGSDFEGVCWPGLSSYIDFLNPEARDYYASWYSYDKFVGSTEVLAGVWNDMNEPSVFDDTLEKTFPFDLVHYGNVVHRDIHNIYGFLQTKATYQGLIQRDNNTKRPFILTRSHFAGSQRYAAMWTGDNTADWPYLRVSYSECILSNLLGHVFCGADIGGFSGNPDAELLQRWYQAGVWLPFFRGHAEKTTEHREPYLFPENVQSVIRTAIKLRYKHIPYFYTLFYEHKLTGDPVIRPIFYHYPGVVNTNNYILIGANILATPVLQQGAVDVSVTFPFFETLSERWYRVDDDSWSVYGANATIVIPTNISTSPYFYKAGSIISRKDVERRSTTDMQNDPFTLFVNLDKDDYAVGRLYVDDYTSFDYKNKLLLAYLEITYDRLGQLSIKLLQGDPSSFSINIDRIIIHKIEKSGEFDSEKTIYTKTVDGEDLKTINISDLLNAGTVDLKLKI